MPDQEKSEKRIGLTFGKATFGLELKESINAMKPGDVRFIKGHRRIFLVRYWKNGEITVLDLMDGSELYRG
jgi:hypothetical protein